MTAFGCFVLAGVVALVYLLWRNERVFRFRIFINDLCHKYSEKHIPEDGDNYVAAYDWLHPRIPGYARMLFSLRPLKLKYWLHKEDIEKLLA